MNRLAGKTAVITGGTSGIGLASAKLFASEGAQLYIMGRRQLELDAAIAAIGHGVRGVQGDVSRMADLDALYEIVGREVGAIDILFANAGGGTFVPLASVSEEHYAQTFDINVKGTVFTVQKALPILRDGASIILTGSTSAVTGIPAFSMYSASKAAIRNFARGWILELAPRSIRVNVLTPGSTSTPGWHALAGTEEEERAMISATIAATPAGRLGRPEEIARAALFLASDDSSYVNGSELFVDGGSAQI